MHSDKGDDAGVFMNSVIYTVSVHYSHLTAGIRTVTKNSEVEDDGELVENASAQMHEQMYIRTYA